MSANHSKSLILKHNGDDGCHCTPIFLYKSENFVNYKLHLMFSSLLFFLAAFSFRKGNFVLLSKDGSSSGKINPWKSFTTSFGFCP